MTDELTISDLWLDANQGEQGDGRAFGYIGTDEETTDDEGEDCEFCGWFFSWPGNAARVTTKGQVAEVVSSLELDETAKHLPAIPHSLAVARLRAMLEKNLSRHS